MKDKEITELAQCIEMMLEHIINTRVQKLSQTESKSTEKYDWLITEIDNELNNATLIQNQNKENNLSVNSIENEGYIRALLYIKGMIEQIENTYKEGQQ